VGLKVLTSGVRRRGRLVFGISATLSEFERDLIHDRNAGGPSPFGRRQLGATERRQACSVHLEKARSGVR
jgi:hypothetical protein